MGRSFLVTMYIGRKSLEETISIVFPEVSGQRALPPNPTSVRTQLSRYNPTQPSRPRLKVLGGVICICLHVSLSALVLQVLFLYLRLCVCVFCTTHYECEFGRVK